MSPIKWTAYDLTCSCEYDAPCFKCGQNQCEECCAGMAPETPACYITDRRGRVWRPATMVWEVGYSHRWTCKCLAAGHPNARPVQGVLL